MSDLPEPSDAAVETFIARWKNSGAAERANAQLFLSEFCDLLSLPHPDPSLPDDAQNTYVFERNVHRPRPDGTVTTGRIDLYRRRAFVLESKQGVETADAPKLGHGKRGTATWDLALERAYHQACGYVKDLPAAEGRPPFVIVCDVGHCFELYSEFTCTGGTYVRFPDPHKHRITLDDLRLQPVRERFRRLWLDPLSLDPSRQSARVTREIAGLLAKLATSLEADGHDAQVVAAFLQRCLFSLFAEDTGLLPDKSFSAVIARCQSHPQGQVAFFTQVWQEMDRGTEFSTLLNDRIRRFNGEFFKSHSALPLNKAQLQLLADAAKADWTTVEPAIFGTLLERALDPSTRHRLGAHYTPRAYVERLVFPAVIQPLRDQWSSVKAAAAQFQSAGKEKEARAALRTFHQQLADVRVLDPACGSGNFLYVTFEHLKRLEGEVVELREALGDTQQELDLASVRVHPSHFLGLELNPRAAALAELVLWIGYLQWQHRSGKFLPDDPVLSSTRSVTCADAVLASDGMEAVKDENGQVLRRWDGRTTKKHPVTGEDVPDESATAPVLRPINPRPAPPWPDADYIVGNPPFIGNKRMRDALGDGYTEALRKCWPAVPDSADFVMYWWHRAASLVCQGKVKRFGLITTNSITQTFNRRIVEAHLEAPKESGPGGPPGSSAQAAGPAAPHSLKLLFAIPDHPWVDSADGAAVRIAMTIGAACAPEDPAEGILATVTGEKEASEESEGVEVTLREVTGTIHSDLSVGADVVAAVPLKANSEISSRGVIPHGEGFTVTLEQARALGFGAEPELANIIKPYRNGKDFAQKPRGVYVIDLFGHSIAGVQQRFPAIYQHLLLTVKPARDQNPDKSRRENWWLFARSNEQLRNSLRGVLRYIATVQTSKHRVFAFLDGSILPDDKLIAVGLDDGYALGVLSSVVHVQWALAVGAWMGVGNDPVYNKTTCFETFPFPALAPDSELAARIRALGEQLDAHRKARQALHPELTLTGMYNVLTKLRSGDSLTAKEKAIHGQGLVSVLQKLHDDLDAAVLAAYGWSDLAEAFAACHHGELINPETGSVILLDASPEGFAAATAEHEDLLHQLLLKRLAALNQERAAEEAAGHIRYLRPDFQARHLDCGSPLPLSEGDEGAGSGAGEDLLPGSGITPPSPPPAARQSQSGRGLPQSKTTSPDLKAKSTKLPWPADLPAQATAVRQQLTTFPRGATAAQLAARFTKAPKATVAQLLETLTALGQATLEGELYK